MPTSTCPCRQTTSRVSFYFSSFSWNMRRKQTGRGDIEVDVCSYDLTTAKASFNLSYVTHGALEKPSQAVKQGTGIYLFLNSPASGDELSYLETVRTATAPLCICFYSALRWFTVISSDLIFTYTSSESVSLLPYWPCRNRWSLSVCSICISGTGSAGTFPVLTRRARSCQQRQRLHTPRHQL